MSKEAMKLALEALEQLNNTNSYWWQEVDRDIVDKIEPAITAIKETLAQPEQPAPVQQEPVAWMYQHPNNHLKTCYQTYKPNGKCAPLYTAPQPAQRKPLTDEQIQEVVTKAVRERKLSWLGFKKDDQGEYTSPVLSLSDYQMARAIEAAHGIKENA